jgi:hypothetical protein
MTTLTVVVVVAAVAAAFAFYGLRSETAPPPEARPVATAPSDVEAAMLRTLPSSRAAPRAIDMHARIFDSKDMRAAVEDARRNGTPDEKQWAYMAAFDCWRLVHHPEVVPAAVSSAPEQVKARSEIEKRCAGFASMTLEERRALGQELEDAASASTTDYAQLHRMAVRTAGPPPNEAELQVIGKAIYGDDALLKREAVWALAGAVDQTKVAMFLSAFHDETAAPISEFEALQHCLGDVALCPSSRLVSNALPADATVADREEAAQERLIREAVANKVSVQALVASLKSPSRRLSNYPA